MASELDPYSQHDLLVAYGSAMKAGDKDAIDELHGELMKRMATNANPVDSGPAPIPKIYDQATKSYIADPNVHAEQATGQNELEGIGRGMVRLPKGAGNLIGLGRVFPNTLGDKAIQESDKLDKPLLDTPGGSEGDVIGQSIDMLPVNAAGGALTKTLGILKALPAGSKLAPRALQVLKRAGIAGGENALQGAAMADPENQVGGAVTGAALGSGLSLVGSAGGRFLRGAVKKTDAAQNLIHDADETGRDLFIPISQGAKPGVAKFTYQKVLPYALGAEQQLRSQSGKAQATVLDTMLDSATPVVNVRGTGLVKMKAPIGATPAQTSADVATQFDKQYTDKLKSYTLNTPDNFHARVKKNVLDAFPDLPENQANQIAATLDSRLQEYAKDGTITGGNLQEALGAARADVKDLLNKNIVRSKPATEAGLQSFKDIVDDTIEEHTSILRNPKASATDHKAAFQVIDDLENYKRLGDQWKEFAPLKQAIENNPATRGRPGFAEIANNADPTAENLGRAQDAVEVFGESPGGVNPAGRHALNVGQGLIAASAGGAAVLGHPAGLAFLSGANLAATKSAQKALYGDTAMQRALANYLRNNPMSAYMIGGAGRSAVNAP